MPEVFLHADLDAFFASVEQNDNASLKGKPVIVGALPGKRGVVSACSYEARRFGIHSAMPISSAIRLCPQGEFLPVRMERYSEISNRIMRLLESFSPRLMQISIDEALLDLSGTQRLLGQPDTVAKKIKQHIKAGFGLSVSIGIAPNKFLAKLASQYKKPDGLFRVYPGEEESFLDSLSLKDLYGVGKKTAQRLAELGITSVRELRCFSEETLMPLFGRACGRYLYQAVRGIDPGIFPEMTKSRSISSESTFEHDCRDVRVLKKVLLELSHQVMFRLIRDGQQSRTVAIKIRLDNFETIQTQTTAKHSFLSAEEVYTIACSLLEKKWNQKTPLRLVGIALANVTEDESFFQPELFEDDRKKRQKTEEAVLKIRNKYTRNAITKARLLKKDKD